MIKRSFDIFVSATLLLMLLPLLGMVAILVRFRLGGPVLFTQTRVGLHSRLFDIYKFRTMSSSTGDDGRPLPDAQRMTRLGNFLRRTSLDELPELWNIVRGDMSLVGPRPLLPEYIELYDERQRRRHEVRPGLTGWAQINGRNAISWEERFELDVWYVENHHLALDLAILWKTVAAVISQSGVSPENDVTMPPFTGSLNRSNLGCARETS